jgi:excisionase family DNA binding protein
VTPKLMTKPEAAEALGVCLRTLDKLIARGSLKAIKPLGTRLVRITADELQRFIEAA